MRKLLALLLLVAVVTSAFAFANSFTVNSQPETQGQQDISSGTASVSQCVSDLEIDVRGGDFNPALDDFEVGLVILTAGSDCAGDSVKVTFTDQDGGLITTVPGRLTNGGNLNLDVSEKDIAVSEVANVHVMIEANRPLSRTE